MRSELKVPAFVLLVVLGASNVDAQGSRYQALKVRSCAYADSLLGPVRDDTRAEVQGFYHTERDSTYLISGAARKNRPSVHASIKLAGQRPTRSPSAQIAVYLRGDDATLIQASSSKPVVTMQLNDSVTIEPADAALGTFIGPTGVPVTLPVSALVLADDLLSVAEARAVVMNVGPLAVTFSPDERRAVRALLRVAVCPP